MEEKIINQLAEEKEIPIRQAMDIYYRSKLSQQINDGSYGIENMDYRYLVQDLIENEPELFEKKDNRYEHGLAQREESANTG